MSGHRRGAGDRPPAGAALGSGLAIGFGGQTMAARAKVGGDRAVGGEETLRVPRRFEAPHAPFALPRRLVRVFRAIIQPLVPPVLHARQHLPLGGLLARERVGDDHARDLLQTFQQPAEECPGRHLVAAALDQDIEHIPGLIDGPPQRARLALDADEDLIEVPVLAV